MDDKQNVKEEQCVASILENHETTCWGCGLHLLLETYSPIFKCGWCGAITHRNKALRKPDSACFSHWRLVRDRFFVTILLFFMLFVICAGVWAVYPVVFSVSYFCGIFHSTLTAILSISTISSFCLAAFRSAGAPTNILWGSYPIVAKGDLENYTFCMYCAKPKPPRAHHCRSCRTCVLDMDHHCPFIGNCVGAANHRFFIAFLMSVIISCTYVVLMMLYAGFHTWPPLELRTLGSTGFHIVSGTRLAKEIVAALASSALLLSARGLVHIYLAFACLTVEIGLSVLLCQQLYYIYEGNTYINHINSRNGWHGEKGFQNLLRFFGCPYLFFKVLPGLANAGKLQDTSGSKLL
ncbi:protein S-acyltransferase 11 [Elaeis guineensis]|uniref:S-acyltransferase n=1 Tax=Elaeis guineensis var. tenera TaxID=51953 RepID=A0A6I9SBK6_ELAGV|nr:protein S-acyltransferase 11 [Elaeis guineensis]XP_010940330.1 protein S-acyltransferase 11 [Elaeis guineensis]XP_010940331.1 protein S-acyltransferase 11 [Elaeis guineensis]XP_019711081.1 protein S-acyltransferase 11 [Elaeis guineensis]